MKLFSLMKSLCIMVLTVLAMYQTGRLWFENSLDHDLFYTLTFPGPAEPDRELAASFAVPYRLIVNYSDNKFSMKYSNIAESESYKQAAAALSAFFKEAEYLGVYPLDYNELLSSRSFILEYPFNMPSDTFAAAKGQKGGLFKMSSFSSIILALDEDTSDRIVISFTDATKIYSYSLRNIAIYDGIKKAILKKPPELYYVAVSGGESTEKNFYFPKWEGEMYNYSAIKITADYYGEELLNVGREIEANINPFFENPSAKLFYNANGVLTFDDSNKVVKYFDNDILEYTNYKRDSSKKGSSFLTDYALAVSFIKNDAMNKNGYYLADFEEDGNTRHFYFDYVYNDLPVVIKFDEILGEAASEESAMSHAIEISIEDGTLYKYKKLCYTFRSDETTEFTASLDFISYVSLVTESPLEEIESILTGYYVNKKYDKVRNLSNFDLEADVNRARIYYFIKPANTPHHLSQVA